MYNAPALTDPRIPVISTTHHDRLSNDLVVLVVVLLGTVLLSEGSGV